MKNSFKIETNLEDVKNSFKIETNLIQLFFTQNWMFASGPACFDTIRKSWQSTNERKIV